MLYRIDENHCFYKDLAERITILIYNKEFSNLQSELEVLYRRLGSEKPKVNAFQDTLYSFLIQEEGLEPAKVSLR